MDAAHGLGLAVLLDVVHSHVSSNSDDGLAGFDVGQARRLPHPSPSTAAHIATAPLAQLGHGYTVCVAVM